MRYLTRIAPTALLIFALADTAQAQWSWQTATPESQGMSSIELQALRVSLGARGTSHFLVIRNDKIVYEWYASGQSRTTTHSTASMAKGLVGGVSLGVAMTDGLIALDDLAKDYVPQWVGSSLKSQIKVRHLGSHTSGIEDAEQNGIPHDQLPGWKGAFWRRQSVPNDPFTISRDQAPVLFTPGTADHYSNPGFAMLTYTVTASLRNAPVRDVRTLLRDRVMRPIGVPDGEWSCGYGATFTVDGLPLVASWGGGSYSPNATARLARLLLRQGNWEGQQLLSAAAVQAIVSDAGTPGNGGQGFWINSDGSLGTAPANSYFAAGDGHQVVFVVPGLNLIAVRNGSSLDGSLEFTEALRRHFFDPLMDAVIDAPTNNPPTVSAGADQTITLPASAALDGTVTDDGRPINTLTTSWSKVSGPGTVIFGNPGAVDTTASFVASGTYVLRLTASDGALTVSDDVTILVSSQGGAPIKLWIPANSGSLSGAMAESTDYAAGSLTGQLLYPNLDNYNTGNVSEADAATYPLVLPTAGTWYLWGRIFNPGDTALPTNDPNSFWASIDGGSAQILGNLTNRDGTWHWDGTAGGLLPLGNLTAGSHTLKIWNREARETPTAKLSPRLDMLLVTNDPAYVPRDEDVDGGGPIQLWIPANSGSLSGAMAKSTDYAAGSLTGLLLYPNLNNNNTGNVSEADAATYPLVLPTTGTWYLWGRIFNPGDTALPTNDPNSFWVSIDGGTAQVLGNLTNQDGTWHWDGSAGELLSLGNLTAGSHTLKIWNREARETPTVKLSPRLDMLLVTNDPAYVP